MLYFVLKIESYELTFFNQAVFLMCFYVVLNWINEDFKHWFFGKNVFSEYIGKSLSGNQRKTCILIERPLQQHLKTLKASWRRLNDSWCHSSYFVFLSTCLCEHLIPARVLFTIFIFVLGVLFRCELIEFLNGLGFQIDFSGCLCIFRILLLSLQVFGMIVDYLSHW